jgi:hypothetical protein
MLFKQLPPAETASLNRSLIIIGMQGMSPKVSCQGNHHGCQGLLRLAKNQPQLKARTSHGPSEDSPSDLFSGLHPKILDTLHK